MKDSLAGSTESTSFKISCGYIVSTILDLQCFHCSAEVRVEPTKHDTNTIF